MESKLATAKRLYLEGIGEGNIQIVRELSGATYIQHSTGVKDGPNGFIEFFDGFLKRTGKRNIRVIRAIEDGRFVFLHVFQDIDDGAAQWVTTDMFDTDEENKVIEHWDVIAAYTPQSASGRDVIFGEFEVIDLEKTEENKALVRSFLVDVFQNANHDKLDHYISDQTYLQHNPNVPDGIEALRDFVSSGKFNYDFVFRVIGQGNYTVSYSKATYDGQAYAVFDIFRIENGKIVEHWDNMEPIPPRDQWTNTGKF